MLELHGAEIAARGVSSFRVVEALDVVEHVCPGVVPGSIDLAGTPFGFERGEEALHRRIVPDIAGPAHGTIDTIVIQQQPELFGCVLGRFKRPSQHPKNGGNDDSLQTRFRSVHSEKVTFAWTSTCLAA